MILTIHRLLSLLEMCINQIDTVIKANEIWTNIVELRFTSIQDHYRNNLSNLSKYSIPVVIVKSLQHLNISSNEQNAKNEYGHKDCRFKCTDQCNLKINQHCNKMVTFKASRCNKLLPQIQKNHFNLKFFNTSEQLNCP